VRERSDDRKHVPGGCNRFIVELWPLSGYSLFPLNNYCQVISQQISVGGSGLFGTRFAEAIRLCTVGIHTIALCQITASKKCSAGIADSAHTLAPSKGDVKLGGSHWFRAAVYQN
jgi:hypothetical protein